MVSLDGDLENLIYMLSFFHEFIVDRFLT
jgi:hypothetical protein